MDGKYGTALAAAAFNGRMHVMPLLLDRGADINSVSGDYVTALGAAVVAQRKVVVSLKKKKKRKKNSPDSLMPSPD